MFTSIVALGLLVQMLAMWRRLDEKVVGHLNPNTDVMFVAGVVCWLLAPLVQFFAGLVS